ncbi:MAG: hypothetical protein ABJA60_11705 [Nitrosospira sp.]
MLNKAIRFYAVAVTFAFGVTAAVGLSAQGIAVTFSGMESEQSLFPIM